MAAAIEDVYANVLTRVERLPVGEREKLEPLIAELRRAIHLALPPAAAD